MAADHAVHDIASVARRITPQCPLCGGTDASVITTSDRRRYFECARCALVHLYSEHWLSRAEERARYELHENDKGDPGYVDFLRRLADPVMARLTPGARGLDFGSGPTPVLAQLLSASGFPCAVYDPFFAPDESLLNERYDFITCSEVAEHARDPAVMFATLHDLLRPAGVLGVMTRLHPGAAAFEDWWYRRDPTHVCFYNEATMRWIAGRYGSSVDFPGADVAMFTAPR